MKLKSLLLPLFTVIATLSLGSCKPKADSTPTDKTTIKLSQVSIDLEEGKSIKLNAILTPLSAKETITWETSNKEIATVKDNGVVTGVKAGEATITAKLANGNSATCKVKVTAPKVEPTPTPDPNQGGDKKKPGDKDIIYKLKFEQTSYTVEKGKSIEIKAIVTAIGDNELPEGIQSSVTYSGGKVYIQGQGEDQLAIVSTNGKVEGVNLGKCKVKAELKGAETIECEVEVIEAKINIPAGAKIGFECDGEIITELKFDSPNADAKFVDVVFLDQAGKKLDIEGIDSESFTYKISQVKDGDKSYDIAKVTFAGWGPNGFAGEGTITVTYKANTELVGVLKVIVAK